MKTINFDKHVWEGWTVQCFIDDLDLIVRININNGTITNASQMKAYCQANQPYYKKPIPEVYRYFVDKYLTT